MNDTATKLDDAVRKSRCGEPRIKILQSTPGVGPVVSHPLISDLPELGRSNRKQISALAGVASFARDSGTLRGKRTVWGGRGSVRATLYMATLVGVRHHVVLRDTIAQAIVGRRCLPTRLSHAGDHAPEGKFPQDDAADAEFPIDAPRTSGDLTPVLFAGGKLGRLFHASEYAFACHSRYFSSWGRHSAPPAKVVLSVSPHPCGQRGNPVRSGRTCSSRGWTPRR